MIEPDVSERQDLKDMTEIFKARIEARLNTSENTRTELRKEGNKGKYHKLAYNAEYSSYIISLKMLVRALEGCVETEQDMEAFLAEEDMPTLKNFLEEMTAQSSYQEQDISFKQFSAKEQNSTQEPNLSQESEEPEHHCDISEEGVDSLLNHTEDPSNNEDIPIATILNGREEISFAEIKKGEEILRPATTGSRFEGNPIVYNRSFKIENVGTLDFSLPDPYLQSVEGMQEDQLAFTLVHFKLTLVPRGEDELASDKEFKTSLYINNKELSPDEELSPDDLKALIAENGFSLADTETVEAVANFAVEYAKQEEFIRFIRWGEKPITTQLTPIFPNSAKSIVPFFSALRAGVSTAEGEDISIHGDNEIVQKPGKHSKTKFKYAFVEY